MDRQERVVHGAGFSRTATVGTFLTCEHDGDAVSSMRRAGVRLASARRVHELALIEDLVEAVTDETAGARVHVVRLRVGRDACVSVDALHFCFDVCTRGTGLEGAALEIIEGVGDELRLQEVEVT